MATVKFYFDEMMPRKAAEQVTQRGYEVLMSVDAENTGKADFEHLRFASERGCIMVTFDRPFAGKAQAQFDHAGVICLGSDIQENIGAIVRTLQTFADTHTSDAAQGRVFWL